MIDSNNKPNYLIATTDDYERLVPFFVANDLEFPDEEDYEVPTDLVQCWKVTEGAQPEPDEDSAEYKTDHHRLIGGFVLAERQGEFIVDGIAVLGETGLIPFKAKAFLDLSQRKAIGEHVDSRDLRKHKNDVLRLAQILKPGQHVELAPTIRADMSEFCDKISDDDANMRQLGISASYEDIIELNKIINEF